MDLSSFLNLSIIEKSLKLKSIDGNLQKIEIPNVSGNIYICIFTDSTYHHELSDDDRLLRGLIFNNDTKEVISRTYPVQYDVQVANRTGHCVPFEAIPSGKTTITELKDGTLLRLTCIGGIWTLSTNAKWDASTSRWNNVNTFKYYFDSIVTIDKEKELNKDYIYHFILCHPDNTIVINHSSPKIYHVATIDKTSGKEVSHKLTLENIHYPEELSLSVEEAYNSSTEITDLPQKYAGYMIAVDNGNVVKRYRMETSSYIKAKLIVGKLPIKQQITLLLLEGNPEKISSFLTCYPNHKAVFNDYSNKFANISKHIYDIYVSRHIQHNKQFIQGPSIHKFVAYLHTIYLTYLKQDKKSITYVMVSNILKNIPLYDLCKMIDEYKVTNIVKASI